MTTADAQIRLQAALDRLESAARALNERAGAANGAEAEIAALKDDCERLRAELEVVRRERAALAEINETASRRLDSAIVRLKGAMEG